MMQFEVIPTRESHPRQRRNMEKPISPKRESVAFILPSLFRSLACIGRFFSHELTLWFHMCQLSQDSFRMKKIWIHKGIEVNFDTF